MPPVIDVWIYLGTGIFAGTLAGLFGVGGGMIIVPALVFVLPRAGVAPALTMQIAIGTSLAVIALTSLSSTRSHHRRGSVRWDLLRSYGPGLVVGALVGAVFAHYLSGTVLKRLVGIGALLMSVQMWRSSMRAEKPTQIIAKPELLLAGGVVGLLSSLIGIGGGSLTVPYLSLRGVRMPQCVGTAAAGGVPIAWAGALGFVIMGWHLPHLPVLQAGYVNLTAFACIASASVWTAPLGARLAHGLPPERLKRCFAVFNVGIGVWMLTH